jgi:hypothetical protein
MNAFWNFFESFLGLGVEPKDLTFVQISLRGIIVFLVTLITMRLGHKRSLSRKTPFDAVLLVILAAVLSRAINGSAAFFATLGGGVVLVLLHRLFAPDLMATRLTAFEKFYSWIDARGLDYFRRRVTQARRDSDEALAITLDHCNTPELQRYAVRALEFKCDVLWSVLDAIHHAYSSS